MSKKEVVVQVKDLEVSFRTNQGFVRAVRGVSFDLYRGETLAIVGESGSGKSVTSRSIMGILAGNAVVNAGQIFYQNQDLIKISEDDFHKIRGNKIGMIFQDPTSALNPIMRVGKQITEAMILNGNRRQDKIKALYHNEEVEIININIRKDDIIADETLSKEEKNAKLEVIKQELVVAKEAFKAQKRKAIQEVNAEYKLITEKYKKEVDEYKEAFKAYSKDNKEKYAKIKPEFKSKVEQMKLDFKKDLSKFKKNSSAKTLKFKLEIKQMKNDFKGRVESLRKDMFKVGSDAEVRSMFSSLKYYFSKRREMKDLYRRNFKVTKTEARLEAYKIMSEVGIAEPEKRFKMYPFQFSGGMKQRIVIAIALMAQPEVLICDEPTTALDVTIQAQILDLIKRIKKDRNLSVIFITHNLGVVANVADRVAVMYAGKVVEYGTLDDVFYNPKHPYTWALMSSMPDINSKEKLQTISGTPPNMLFPPKGDAFAQRNPYAMAIDFEEQPPLFKVSEEHYAATWLLHPDAPKVELPEIIKERITFMKSEAIKLRGEKHGK